jgi:hypothetical protein
MTDDDRNDELAAEPVEDLEAPAAALGDVAGGKGNDCATPTCVGGTKVVVHCLPGTCSGTGSDCSRNTGVLILYDQ